MPKPLCHYVTITFKYNSSQSHLDQVAWLGSGSKKHGYSPRFWNNPVSKTDQPTRSPKFFLLSSFSSRFLCFILSAYI